MSIEGVHLIAGESVAGQGTFHATNPASGERLSPQFSDATADQIDAAVAAAFQVHESRGAEDPQARARLLDAAAARIEQAGAAITKRGVEETGLPEGRFEAERGRTCNQLRMFASVLRERIFTESIIETALPDRQPVPRPDLRRRMRALGPVAVFGASNFPLAFGIAGSDTASALAAGCPVIAKGHPAHPGCCELIGKALQEAVRDAELPAGIFSLVQGQSFDVGTQLVQHPGIAAVAFTGSRSGGISLWKLAATREVPVPVFAEMGSANPVFILPEALATRGEEIASSIAVSVRLGVGQFCTSPGIIVTVSDDHGEAFKESLSASLCSEPPGTMLHPGIREGYSGALEQLASSHGVEVLRRGPTGSGACDAEATLLQADALSFIADKTLQGEVFGPSTMLVECSSLEEMLRVARTLEGQLTATVHGTTDELQNFRQLLDLLEDRVGRILFNGMPTGVEVGEAMHHGGPWPATTDSRWTSVGAASIQRFVRPVCWQGFPDQLLPADLRSAAKGRHRIDGVWQDPGSV
ncbi:MAG: aldehyde dehydrogenase (NADP(+)) [Planctomycetota bacterium]|nr:aldehyde dehydrogenase (NADP(+)) [Planctomycetota bacterium]